MKKIRPIYPIILMMCNFIALNAQDFDDYDEVKIVMVSARVVDNSGNALPGFLVASGNAKGTTFTDKEGFFSINAEENDVLIITGFEYNKTQFLVKGGKLPSDTLIMDKWGVLDAKESINIAFGTMDFERITGSIERITGDELVGFPTVFVREALAGRLSGLTSSYGQNSPVRERFSNSIRSQGQGETFVDGVQFPFVLTAQEVDDIVIAKDYGSSFLYGGFAAPGAMIVNSKTGFEGERSIKVKMRSGYRIPTFLPNTLNVQDYARIYNKALANDNLPPLYSEEDIAAYGTAEEGSLEYPVRDFYGELLNSFSRYDNITANFSGGSSTARYFSHLGYYGADGVESVGEGRQRTRLRLNNNLQLKLNDLISANIGVGGSFTKVTEPLRNGDQVFADAYNYPANAYPYKINDTLFTRDLNYPRNLLRDLAFDNSVEDNERDAFARLGVDIDLSTFLKGLTFKSLVNLYSRSMIQTRFTTNPAFAILDLSQEGNFRNVQPFVVSRSSRGGASVFRNQSALFAMNYDREFTENHKLTTDVIYYYRGISGIGLPQDRLFQNIGLRANYFLLDKYVVETNFMNVGIRELAGDKGGFPNYAGGLGWLLHKESFMKNARWLDFLKLRANYGVQADISSVLGIFDFRENVYTVQGSGSFGTQGQSSPSAGHRRLRTGNTNLTAPQKEYLNVGFDFQLFGSKLNGQMNYFNVRDFDRWGIGTASFAIVPTAFLPTINLEERQRKGYDGRIVYTDKIGKLHFTADVNAMYSKEVINRNNSIIFPEDESYRNQIGRATDAIMGLEALGLYRDQTEVDGAPESTFGAFRPGDIRYRDFNDDGIINELDQFVIGHGNRFFYGVNLRMRYKNLSLSVHGDGAAGGQYIENLHWNRGNNDYEAGIVNSWFLGEDNSNATLPRLSTINNPNNYRSSTFWLENAGFFNLRSISMAYQLPQQVTKKLDMESIILYVSAKNIHTFSSVRNRYLPSRNAGYGAHPVLGGLELGFEVSF